MAAARGGACEALRESWRTVRPRPARRRPVRLLPAGPSGGVKEWNSLSLVEHARRAAARQRREQAAHKVVGVRRERDGARDPAGRARRAMPRCTAAAASPKIVLPFAVGKARGVLPARCCASKRDVGPEVMAVGGEMHARRRGGAKAREMRQVEGHAPALVARSGSPWRASTSGGSAGSARARNEVGGEREEVAEDAVLSAVCAQIVMARGAAGADLDGRSCAGPSAHGGSARASGSRRHPSAR